MEELQPPLSTQLSSQQTNLLDIVSGVGGHKSSDSKVNSNLNSCDTPVSNDLEDGEIESDIESCSDSNDLSALEEKVDDKKGTKRSRSELDSDSNISDADQPFYKISKNCKEEENASHSCNGGGFTSKDSPVAAETDTQLDPGSDRNHSTENGQDEDFHELQIIDDLPATEGDVEGEGESEEEEEDLDDNELYALLDEGLDRKEDTGEPVQREKIVLKEKGQDPFEVLPEGWVVVTHNSGMPVYLHKQSRVCTLSKPYFLGPGSVRKHDIPVSAVPCLHYRREKEKENTTTQEESQEDSQEETDGSTGKEASEKMTNGQVIENGSTNGWESGGGDIPALDPSLQMPSVKIEYAEEHNKKSSLDPVELRGYCENLFEFKTITVKKFKTWKDRRKHLTEVKKQSRPALPSNTKLITCTIPHEKGEDKPKKKEFVLNPSGKSFVCILHEYTQHTFRLQPKYIFKELENAQNPYSATVVINDINYGTGFASSKKQAKVEAAKKTLDILIPQMRKVSGKLQEDTEDLSYFDEIKIEDPRVSDLCNKAGQPSPYQLLQECLRRNFGMGDTQCKIEVNTLKQKKSEYTLTVGIHKVTVVCKNKREGKQRAAQALLKDMHPHVHTLGSFLRLYGRSSNRHVKEMKKEESAINELQSNKPNYAVLEKLRIEMKKLQAQREAFKCKGSMRVETSSLPTEIKSVNL